MKAPRRDLIGVFVRHGTAANLLMAFLIVIGLFSLARLNTQFFPKFTVDWITVTVDWPGASAEDIDANIVSVIEPKVRFLDSVYRVSSQSSEGVGLVAIQFQQGTDLQAALGDVESEVAQLTTLPADSENPVVQRVYSYEPIGRLILSGPYPEASLKSLAKDIREGLLAKGVDRVGLAGARREEIWVELHPRTMRRLNLEAEEIATSIRQSSLDLPSGIVPSGTDKQIRSLGLAKTAEEIGHIEVRALDNGEKIRLRDIAHISDRFNKDDPLVFRSGQPAIELQVQRAPSSDALEQTALLNEYVREIRPSLPANLKLEQYNDVAEAINDRINLLLKNGASGLALVVAVLFIFLSGRVAFWVAVGIPVAMLATLAAMALMGQSINMVSLFAMIMAIGIIVDDAIVVGEHSVTRRALGDSPTQAAETGAKRMFAPVIAATLTTLAAFLPLLMVTDIIGQIIYAIPMVIIAILIASLIECFLILPGHLRGALKTDPRAENRFARWFNPRFEAFRDGAFQRFVRACLAWRYFTLSIGLGLLIFLIGLMGGGRIGFVFFPSPESDTVYANVVFVEGTKRETSMAMLEELERALHVVEDKLTGGEGGLVVISVAQLGKPIGRSDSFFLGSGDHIAGMRVELVPSDSRSVRTTQLLSNWRDEIRLMAGTESFTLIEEQSGPPGREIDLRISGQSLTDLKAAALEARALLGRFPGISDVDDDLPFGKQETIMEVTPRGRALDFTTESVGRQVRNAFEGAIAKRFARGDEEITVRVLYARDSLNEADFRGLYLLSPGGQEVPLAEVVAFREKAGFARIRREDGLRTASVTAEVDELVNTSDQIIQAMHQEGLQALANKHGVSVEFRGKAEEQERTLGDMKLGTWIALIAIYMILAAIFSSYIRPIFVMAVIPFGIVGAILGHLILGFDVSVLSLVALLGLAGIVVNDSIILVRSIEERLRAGEALVEAVVGGARDRLRAVILTSVTTMFGLLPLLFETSLQAQF
ncbi:MAG: efflux RND transporter permease subunit, partial [Rhodospirillaceae bacterium]|nr:efflux RND transporter permease subunit [Rhodospirillaceae bacterium]